MNEIHLEKLLMVEGSLLSAMAVAMAAADQMARRRSSWKTEVRSSNFHQKPPYHVNGQLEVSIFI